MNYSIQQKGELIIAGCMKISDTNPYEIFRTIAQMDFINIHGPEHHVLDGACILTAFHNAGGKIELYDALQKLMHEGLRMPGAACGLWGVCGAVTSIGAALAVIDGTGPLSSEDWGVTWSILPRLLQGLPKPEGRDAANVMRSYLWSRQSNISKNAMA